MARLMPFTAIFYFLVFANLIVALPGNLYGFIDATWSNNALSLLQNTAGAVNETLTERPIVPTKIVSRRSIHPRSQCHPHSGVRQRIHFRHYSPNKTLAMTIDTRWLLTYPHTLRTKLTDHGFSLVHTPEEDPCEWNRGFAVERLGVERGVMHCYTVEEHGTLIEGFKIELAAVVQVENILYSTYPVLEICLIAIFLSGPVILVIAYWYFVIHREVFANKKRLQLNSRNAVSTILKGPRSEHGRNEHHQTGSGNAVHDKVDDAINQPPQNWTDYSGLCGTTIHPSACQYALMLDERRRDRDLVDEFEQENCWRSG
jgi:hypothetical protein